VGCIGRWLTRSTDTKSVASAAASDVGALRASTDPIAPPGAAAATSPEADTLLLIETVSAASSDGTPSVESGVVLCWTASAAALVAALALIACQIASSSTVSLVSFAISNAQGRLIFAIGWRAPVACCAAEGAAERAASCEMRL